MAKLNTRKYLIYGSIAAIVGVIGYYIWRDSKNPEEKPKDDGGNEDGGKDGGLKDGQQDGKGSGGSTTPPKEDCPNNSTLKSENAIRKFQYYVINTKGDKTILGKGGESGYGDDGLWGCSTRKAWDKYGADYKKSLPDGKPDTPPVSGITETNRLNFNKLAASFSKPTYTLSNGIRYFNLKFYNPTSTNWGVWTIRLYEQSSFSDKQTSYAILDENGKTVQTGYYTNAGKNMRATTGRNAPFTAPPQTTLAKAISAVLKAGAIRNWVQ